MIKNNTKKRILTSIILLIMASIMIFSNFITAYFLIIFGVFSLIEFFTISDKIFIKNKFRYLVNFFFSVYIILFCYIFFLFSFHPGLKIVLYITILGCVASDIGGFVFGRIFKGPRLTKISPKKTLSGAAGSIVLTCFIISILTYIYLNNFYFHIIIVSILISTVSQIGDLFFSLLKRKARIKDTGTVLPGHGGVLDRVDGILLGVPIGLLLFIFIF